MVLEIGWKNVWRNKTRSVVVIVAVMLGIFAGIMAAGIMQGWIIQRIHDSIYNETSHVQVHNPDFLLNEEMQFTINQSDELISILDTIPEVVAYSPRLKVFSMARTDWGTSGFILRGVDPEKEKQVSELHLNMVAGDYFDGEHKMPSIILGSKAAENLKLLNYQVTDEKLDSIDKEIYPVSVIDKLGEIGNKRYRKEKDFKQELKQNLTKEEFKEFGDHLIKYFSFYRIRSKVTVTLQSLDGKLVHATFRVRGIFKTNNSMFDGMNALVRINRLNEYVNLPDNQFHEIAIISTDNETGLTLADKIEAYSPSNNVMSWKKLSPEIAMYTEFSAVMGLVYVGIILFALAFGIINTMLMSVLERVKELGMLMAIGMNRKRVFKMIMFESIFLTLTGALVGMAFSFVILKITGQTGIDFSAFSEGFEALGYASVIYPTVTVLDYINVTILVILTGVIASIWPARKALKLNPCEALRTE